jgi:hypothetical protein
MKQKLIIRPFPLLYIFPLLLFFIIVQAQSQVPQWNWVRGSGGSGDDYLLGFDANSTIGSMHTDSAGNIYELIYSSSSSITFGTNTYTNSNSAGISYLVKYNSVGSITWSQKFPELPAGGYVEPISMFTNPMGFTSVMMPFQDSLRLGSLVYIDTTIHFTFTGYAGYCIAVFDPNGNVISLKGHKSPYSDWNVIFSYDGNKILALGGARFYPDTLDGNSTGLGSYLVVMDSIGDVLHIKNLGYDTTNPGNYAAIVSASHVAIGKQSVYVALTYLNHPVLNTTSIPINNISAYIDQHIIIRFDSLLNYQWFKACSSGVVDDAPLYVDANENVYMDAEGSASIPEDTLRIDTAIIILPYILPIGQYGYNGIVKMDSSGRLQWIDLFVDEGSGAIYGFSSDRINNVYAMGVYSSSLFLGPDTAYGYGNIFVAKVSSNGSINWMQNSQNAQGHIQTGGIAEDGRGNIYINGIFYDSNHPFFGTDSLVCHTPVANHPLYGDIFTAKLGTCSPHTQSLMASSSLTWCGLDSVVLTAPSGYKYLWSNGDTTISITALRSGYYYALSADTIGCYAQSLPDTIRAFPEPILNVTVLQEVLCKGGSDGRISLNTDNATGFISYSFSPVISDTSQVSSGNYFITVTDSAGCLAHDSMTVTEPSTSLSIQIDSVPTSSSSADGIAIALVAGGTPGYMYLWSNNQTMDTINHLNSGWYAITVTDHNGCLITDSVYIKMLTGLPSIKGIKIGLYPNPNDGTYTVDMPINGQLTLSDINGQILTTKELITGINSLSETMSAGTYFIEIQTEDFLYSSKMIVEK